MWLLRQTQGTHMSHPHPAIAFLFWLAVVFAAAVAGSAFTREGLAQWYTNLRKPSFNPPNWVFAPVWTILYILMAVAIWLVRQRGDSQLVLIATILFVVQLALNVLWTMIFFRLRSPRAAFAEIIILWSVILATLVAFWQIKPVAGALMLPYQLWVTFAAALNLAIARLNT